MSFTKQHNIGAVVKCLRASDNASLTAAGSGDNTQVVGAIIDRAAYDYPLSMVAVITAKATLTTNKKLTLKSVILEHGDASNLSDAATLFSPSDVDVLTATGSGQSEYDWDLAGAKRYIRLSFTPDLNATATDTAECAAVAVLGGTFTIPI